MIYNVRHSKTQLQYIVDCITNQHQFCQGWGGDVDGDLDIRKDTFFQACCEYYEDTLNSTRIPTNLFRYIPALEDGDILVTPHIPKYGCASIHIVDGDFPDCYQHVPDDSHLGHRIRIRDSIGMNEELSIYSERLIPWKAKLQWMRLPFIQIDQYWDSFSEIINEFRKDSSTQFEPAQFDRYLNGLAERVAEFLTSELRDLNPAGGEISFERICEILLQETGYTIHRRRWFDGKGGDVDIECRRSLSNASPYEGGDVILYVQAKKFQNEADQVAVDQIIQMIEPKQRIEGCVMSTADGFSDEAEKLADSHGIVLLNKLALSAQLLPFLAKRLG